jgi:hypothetical protein
MGECPIMKNACTAILPVLVALVFVGGCPTGQTLTTPPETAPRVATPEVSIVGDASGLSAVVTISCATPDAVITYSLDDGATWQPYISPVTIYRAPSIKAAATANGYTESEIALGGAFQPRALTLPSVLIKGPAAAIDSTMTVIYTLSGWGWGTWNVYDGAIDLSRNTVLAVQRGSSGQGHAIFSPFTLPNGMKVSFLSVFTARETDWSSYGTDVWMVFSDPITVSAARDDVPCNVEKLPDGNVYVFHDVTPALYDVQAETGDNLFFRFLYSNGTTSVKLPSKGVELK